MACKKRQNNCEKVYGCNNIDSTESNVGCDDDSCKRRFLNENGFCGAITNGVQTNRKTIENDSRWLRFR